VKFKNSNKTGIVMRENFGRTNFKEIELNDELEVIISERVIISNKSFLTIKVE
jgi:hypothetical protein